MCVPDEKQPRDQAYACCTFMETLIFRGKTEEARGHDRSGSKQMLDYTHNNTFTLHKKHSNLSHNTNSSYFPVGHETDNSGLGIKKLTSAFFKTSQFDFNVLTLNFALIWHLCQIVMLAALRLYVVTF